MPHVPLIVDTGASVCISPTKSDFVSSTYKDSNMKVTGLSGVNRVAGEGLIRWAVKDTSGETKVIEIFGLHIPTAGVFGCSVLKSFERLTVSVVVSKMTVSFLPINLET